MRGTSYLPLPTREAILPGHIQPFFPQEPRQEKGNGGMHLLCTMPRQVGHASHAFPCHCVVSWRCANLSCSTFPMVICPALKWQHQGGHGKVTMVTWLQQVGNANMVAPKCHRPIVNVLFPFYFVICITLEKIYSSFDMASDTEIHKSRFISKINCHILLPFSINEQICDRIEIVVKGMVE